MAPKNTKMLWWVMGGLGALFLLSSIAITMIEYRRFEQRPQVFPAGSTVAGLPVGGLSPVDAAGRLDEFYSLPLQLDINGAIVHTAPSDLGFQIDSSALVQSGWEQVQTSGFWPYLWNQQSSTPVDLPLTASVDQTQIEAYLLNEIDPRYTQPAVPVTPIPFTTNFQLGSAGTKIDINQAVSTIEAALLSATDHTATVSVISEPTGDASEQMLIAFLQHKIQDTGFDGVVELYLQAMETGQIIHFAVQDNQTIASNIAFTAASTIKIPIMISVLRRLPEPTPDGAVSLLKRMIVLSENPPADTLMETFLDPIRGPLIVSEDMLALGLENTFLAGYLYLGAPFLQRFETPANTRMDVDLDPDDYSQTTPEEAGELLAAVYHCAADGSGLLTQTFPGEISQTECQLMVDILSGNQIGLLIETSLPPEATVAHKHGWVLEGDGILRPMSDAAIVFSPGGDYVLNVFIYDPRQLDFDEGNRLIARLSQTVYNFFNLEQQAYWWFD